MHCRKIDHLYHMMFSNFHSHSKKAYIFLDIKNRPPACTHDEVTIFDTLQQCCNFTKLVYEIPPPYPNLLNDTLQNG